MEAFRYYLVDELPTIGEGEIYQYGESGDKILVAAKGNIAIKGEEKQYADIKELLELSHANQELNRLITSEIRTKYSVDDEIALLNKQDSTDYREYREYCGKVVGVYKDIKINAGLKER